MTVKELIKKLEVLPEDFDVVAFGEDGNLFDIMAVVLNAEDKTVNII